MTRAMIVIAFLLFAGIGITLDWSLWWTVPAFLIAMLAVFG